MLTQLTKNAKSHFIRVSSSTVVIKSSVSWSRAKHCCNNSNATVQFNSLKSSSNKNVTADHLYFSDNHSIVIHVNCVVMVNNNCSRNYLLQLPVKSNWKSVHFYLRHCSNESGLFFLWVGGQGHWTERSVSGQLSVWCTGHLHTCCAQKNCVILAGRPMLF